MRDRKDIIKDFKICCIDGDCSKGCSYYDIVNECCCEIDGTLNAEVLELLEQNDKDYEDGSKHAWGVARIVANMDTKEFDECFGTYVGLEDVINLYKPEEIKQKINEYENDFHVGDVVKFKDDGTYGVITKINHYINILLCDGSFGLFGKDAIVKTEEHIELSDVLDKLNY